MPKYLAIDHSIFDNVAFNLENLSGLLSISCFIFCSFLFSPVMALTSDWSSSETSQVRLISPYSQTNDKNIIVWLEFQMEPGWKTYWKSF